MSDLHLYREVWLVDFEYGQEDGETPVVRCMVASEYHTGRTDRVWADELAIMTEPPFPIGAEALFVAYFASAELNCFRTLGWQMPQRILDLYIEFKRITNGFPPAHGHGLLGALSHFGLCGIDGVQKTEMRELALRGGHYTAAEREALIDYCETDVVSLAKLLPKMLPHIHLPTALLFGRYMAAVSAMETNGTPLDMAILNRLQNQWEGIQDELIRRIDSDYGVYDGRTFKMERFAKWLIRNNIPWPQTESGRLNLQDDTFRQMAKLHPSVAPLRELRASLGQMRLFDKLAVGADGRNRCILSPFQARTSRNQPSNSKFIFGPATWLRGLIKPPKDAAVAYIDWSAQELGIAAALSGDPAMLQAYESGDPYIRFAKQAGAVPPDATKLSHAEEREHFKQTALATQYGMGAWSLAQRLGQPEIVARDLLRLHRQTYPKFWNWSDGAVNHAMLAGWLETVFRWRIHVGPDPNPRSLRNFLVQGNGAEMLRLACCLSTERLQLAFRSHAATAGCESSPYIDACSLTTR